jgi:putative endonuclease
MSTDLRRTLGAAGEALAATHLERLGHVVLARNHRTRFGELDLVTQDGHTLVFVEVKTRRDSRTGSPWDALHERKRAQVRRMAAAFLSEVTERPRAREIRFDAIGIVVDGQGALLSLDHLEAAF